MLFGIKDKKVLAVVISVCTAFVLAFGAVITALIIILCGRETVDENVDQTYPINGVWIASVSNIDFPSKCDLSAAELKAELDDIVQTAKNAGLNAIFFQVRPCADSLYDSDIFPVSKYMSLEGELTLDALEYLIEAAHECGIGVHAWINPLRVATGGDIEDLPDSSPASKHPDWTVKYEDGKIYFDCGRPEVIRLICDGVKEIVERYSVDGIVFDDYFYPYPKYISAGDGSSVQAVFNDGETYQMYGDGFSDIGEWRRENVNKLVSSVYSTVKAANEDVLFGVAPFGIWKNGYGDESGSETRGAQSYSDIYCDTLAWVEGGYVDYIAPQLYWRSTDEASRYDVLCDWWARMIKDSGARLLISHGAYKYDGDWETPEGIMTEQIGQAQAYDEYGGSIFYGYEEIKNNTCNLFDEIAKIFAEDCEEDEKS